jgi:DNA polymerase III subunit delta
LKIKADQLPTYLRKTLAPCYLVSGDEHLLVAEAADTIRASARDNGFTSRDLHVVTAGFDWSQLRGSASNLSLFAERRIIELRLPTGKPGLSGGAAIVDLVAQADDQLMLIVTAARLDGATKSAKWVKAIEARGVHVPVWPIGVRELPGWITTRMRQAGLQPDRAAVTLIADRVEGNLLAAGQEVEKLRLLLGAGKVSAEDVGRAVADSSRYDVFKLADAALAGDAQRALRILAGLQAEGIEPVVVVWSLARELRTLAGLAESVAQGVELGAAMQKARVWRNRQSLMRACVGRHQLADFYRLLQTSAQADQAAKGQNRADPWQLAADIALGIALSGRKAA